MGNTGFITVLDISIFLLFFMFSFSYNAFYINIKLGWRHGAAVSYSLIYKDLCSYFFLASMSVFIFPCMVSFSGFLKNLTYKNVIICKFYKKAKNGDDLTALIISPYHQ